MFDSGPVTTEELTALVSRLALPDRDLDDAARIEQIAVLERLKGAAAAAQAQVSVDFDTSQREAQAAEGVPARKRGAGVGAQIALARRDSAARGGRHLGLARALVAEMPHTLATLARGETTEWRATIIARETATLSAEHRREVDARLADRLPTLGDRQVEQAARALAYQLDPSSPLRRIRGAVADRRVSIRPAPDAMARVTGFLPWLRAWPCGRPCRRTPARDGPRVTSALVTRSWPIPSSSGSPARRAPRKSASRWAGHD